MDDIENIVEQWMEKVEDLISEKQGSGFCFTQGQAVELLDGLASMISSRADIIREEMGDA